MYGYGEVIINHSRRHHHRPAAPLTAACLSVCYGAADVLCCAPIGFHRPSPACDTISRVIELWMYMQIDRILHDPFRYHV